ncbi:MAG TPA: CpsD/CapB family tyrosine-protein kinase [Steroidobacteraceae bacterium]|nr:CpsD/CapB family tyrosine-protein kinase [Steroidobacteraceae bacterium]
MERIRKALDLARLERAAWREPSAESSSEARIEVADGAPESAVTAAISMPGALAPIVYTHTQVFPISAERWERNRIVDPNSAAAAPAAFRMLRTQVLQRMDAHGWRSLAMFSPQATDGKTTTAINLAISLASDRMHSVLLVEFDLRQPAIAERLGLTPQFGAEDALSGAAAVEDCLYHPDGIDRLIVMPARAALANSSEALTGPRCRQIAAELRARYPERIVLYDLPPVLVADDALAFAPLVDCGLVVAAEGRTRRDDLVRTIEMLHKTPLIGTVLNRASGLPGAY